MIFFEAILLWWACARCTEKCCCMGLLVKVMQTSGSGDLVLKMIQNVNQKGYSAPRSVDYLWRNLLKQKMRCSENKKTRNTCNMRSKTGQRFVTVCPGSVTKWHSQKSHYHRRKRRFGGFLVIDKETSFFQTY